MNTLVMAIQAQAHTYFCNFVGATFVDNYTISLY